MPSPHPERSGRENARGRADDAGLAGLVLVLEPGLAATRRNAIRRRLEAHGGEVRAIDGGGRSYLEVAGESLAIRSLKPEGWDGVQRVVLLEPAAPHAARTGSEIPESSETVVAVPTPDGTGIVEIGPSTCQIIAGPCAVEDEARTLKLAREVQDRGATLFRAGAFKPRTSPYAFQGLERTGLEILARVRDETNLPVVTEVVDIADLDAHEEVVDVCQVGSRNMQNYALLKELGRRRKPVLLKRGFAATIDEFLLAAEYLLSGGNDQVVLCERGIRSAAAPYGVALDLGVVPELRRRTHLPVVVDPSHGSGVAHRVRALSRAAVATGVDGLLIEVHDEPDAALSDGQQALTLDEFADTVREAEVVRAALAGGLLARN